MVEIRSLNSCAVPESINYSKPMNKSKNITYATRDKAMPFIQKNCAYTCQYPIFYIYIFFHLYTKKKKNLTHVYKVNISFAKSAGVQSARKL